MSKFFKFISTILVIFILSACNQHLNYLNINDIDDLEISVDIEAEIDNQVTDSSVTSNEKDAEEPTDVIGDPATEVDLDNLNIFETGIANEGNIVESDFSNVRFSKEQFNDFLVDLVANPDPDEGIMFLFAEITYEDTIELKLDLKAGSLEAIWIAPIWDLLIRQLYVNSEYENEPTIIIRDLEGTIISERDEPFSLG